MLNASLRIASGLLLAVTLCIASGCSTPEFQAPDVAESLSKRTGHNVERTQKPGIFSLPPGINLNQPISDDQAAAIALWNNAAFLEQLTQLELARADFIRAGEVANPTFMALFPIGPKQLEFSASFPLEALWLRERRLAAADLAGQRTAEALVQTGLDLIRDVKLACADLRLQQATTEVKKEASNLLQSLADLAESRLDAGDISALDASNARIEALNAWQQWQRAEADIEVQQVRLQSLLGMGNTGQSLTLEPVATPEPMNLNPTALIKDALANRPDLRAAELALEAAGKEADLAEDEVFRLTAIIDANDAEEDFEIGPGVQFPIPVFNQNESGKALAVAHLKQTASHYVTIRDQISMEIRQSYARWRQALDTLSAWEGKLLPELESAAQMAENGARSGDFSPIQSLQSQYQLATARVLYHNAIADWQKAIAELERALGHSLERNPAFAKTVSQNQP